MLKKTITFKDYNGQERTEDFYFNLTLTEISRMELSTSGGLEEHIKRLIAAQDGGEIMNLIEKIILTAYGEKSPDGRRFMKGGDLSKAFSETPAYDIMFVEFAQDAEKMAAFVNAIIPPLPQENPK